MMKLLSVIALAALASCAQANWLPGTVLLHGLNGTEALFHGRTIDLGLPRRWGASGHAFGRRAFFIGGQNHQAHMATKEVTILNLATNQTYAGPAMSEARMFHASALDPVDHTIVVCGGIGNSDGNTRAKANISQSCEALKSGAAAWTAMPALPQPLMVHAMLADNKGVYVLGGWNGESEQSTVYMLPRGQSSWVQRASIPMAISDSAALVNGTSNLLLCGGYVQPKNASNRCFQYFPQEDFWYQDAVLPDYRFAFGMGMLRNGTHSLAVAFGGHDNEHHLLDSTALVGAGYLTSGKLVHAQDYFVTIHIDEAFAVEKRE